MQFVRQWETPKRKPVAKKQARKSDTVQGAVLPTSKIVERMLSGNMFGLSFTNPQYDSDDPNFDENNPVFIDRSDHILSIYALKNRAQYLYNKMKSEKEEAQKVKEEAQKVKEIADQKLKASSPVAE